MNLSREEARDALAIIAEARARMVQLKRYALWSPILLVWGGVWFLANATSDVAPAAAGWVWMGASLAGMLITTLVSVRFARRHAAQLREESQPGSFARRFIVIGVTVCCFFPATQLILGPMGARRANAFISLCWTCAYMLAGAWAGWRLFVIGAIATAATVYGYLMITPHYFLWMAAFGGGALIAGGLWLRKI